MNSRSVIDSELPVDQDVRPCSHMEIMVNGFADGSLKGPARWYTQLHAMHCVKCNAAVRNLRVVINRVADLRTDPNAATYGLPKERRAELDRALDEVDASSGTAGS